MKKLLTLLSATLFLYACSKDTAAPSPVPGPDPEPEEKEYIVSLKMGGEWIIGDEEEAKSPGSSDDLYGIQIYRTEPGLYGEKTTNYAYGIFDNTTDMVVTLKNKSHYRFEVTLIPDGKDRLPYSTERENRLPFMLSMFLSEPLNANHRNYFIYDSQDFLGELGFGYVELANDGGKWFRPVNLPRYYGETANYVPSEGGSVNIALAKGDFQVHYVVTGLTDGTMTIHMQGSPDIVIHADDEVHEAERTVTFLQLGRAVREESYSEDIVLGATWEREDGTVYEYRERLVSFSRNKRRTITIAAREIAEEEDEDNGIGITLEPDRTFEDDEPITLNPEEDDKDIENPIEI